MKSKNAVAREYAAVKRQLARGTHDRDLWYGFMQALAWVLNDDAAAPRTFAKRTHTRRS